jgi:hypothetical protein
VPVKTSAVAVPMAYLHGDQTALLAVSFWLHSGIVRHEVSEGKHVVRNSLNGENEHVSMVVGR